jgi:hypothetical protein
MTENETASETRLYRLRVLQAALAALAAAFTLWRTLCVG